jgi:hypothetical protein
VTDRSKTTSPSSGTPESQPTSGGPAMSRLVNQPLWLMLGLDSPEQLRSVPDDEVTELLGLLVLEACLKDRKQQSRYPREPSMGRWCAPGGDRLLEV